MSLLAKVYAHVMHSTVKQDVSDFRLLIYKFSKPSSVSLNIMKNEREQKAITSQQLEQPAVYASSN